MGRNPSCGPKWGQCGADHTLTAPLERAQLRNAALGRKAVEVKRGTTQSFQRHLGVRGVRGGVPPRGDPHRCRHSPRGGDTFRLRRHDRSGRSGEYGQGAGRHEHALSVPLSAMVSDERTINCLSVPQRRFRPVGGRRCRAPGALAPRARLIRPIRRNSYRRCRLRCRPQKTAGCPGTTMPCFAATWISSRTALA